MHRYFSHYTFIYPDIYLKNHIVEMDDDRHIVRYFPFEKEIEKTEFHSGLLMFVPIGKPVSFEYLKINDNLISCDSSILKSERFLIYYEKDTLPYLKNIINNE